MGRGGATSRQRTLFEDYGGFVEKFRPKKTTDDCMTPPEVYEVVARWVAERYGVARDDMVRPFWPGGDYEAHEYPEGCCVVDNPPRSPSWRRSSGSTCGRASGSSCSPPR